MKVLRVLVFALMLWQGACVSTGAHFSSKVSWLKLNTTTKEDVVLMLGSPFAVGESGGTQTWNYGFYTYVLFGSSHHKELRIYWNKDNTIQNYSFNSSFPNDIYKAKISSVTKSSEKSATKLDTLDTTPAQKPVRRY